MIRHYAASAAAVALTLSTPAMAESVRLSGKFIGEHGTTTTPQGNVTARLDPATGVMTYRIRYSGLSGPVHVAHLHGPADPGEDAGVVEPISGPYDGQMHGTLHLAPDQVKEVEAGKTYVNLHTADHKDGEARAQLTE